MLLFAVNKKEYKTFEGWHEMPLKKAVELHTFCFANMPGKLKLMYDTIQTAIPDDSASDKALEDVYSSFTNEDLVKIFPKFYGGVIEVLSDCPADVIEQIGYADRTAFYKEHLQKFVFGIMNTVADFEPKHILKFTFEDCDYYLPEAKTVLGQVRPMYDTTALEFSESADLILTAEELGGGKWERAANFISILCRPRGEKYNEQRCIERAERFQNLTMDIVLEVFFCLSNLIVISKQSITISFLMEQLKEQQLQHQAELKTSDGMLQS